MDTPRTHAAAAAPWTQTYAPDGRGAITPPGQLSLLGWRPPVAAPAASEQDRQLARVTGRIGEAVMAFCRSRIGRQFHASDLAAFVMAACGGAPASADRVMRQLRREGHVQVELVDRSGSLYRVLGVNE